MSDVFFIVYSVRMQIKILNFFNIKLKILAEYKIQINDHYE